VSLALQVPAAIFWTLHTNEKPLIALITIALAVTGPLLLLGARRFPGPTVALISAAAVGDFVLGVERQGPPYVALAFAIVAAIVRDARVWAWVSVGTGWAIALAVGFLAGLDWRPAQVAVTTLGILIVFGVGEAVRSRKEHFEQYRAAYAQRRQTEVQAERVRIARELHDVLAHSLSQINVQASVGLHLMDKQPHKASEALASIKETSKTALDEVRSVLGVLRAEDGQDPNAPLVPEPDFSRLTGLVASVTSQGVEVTLTNSVEDAPKAVQLAGYRIVQEALTNVIRHARATRVEVEISESHGAYRIRIADDGDGTADGRDLSGGRGLLGIRERAELLGGTIEVGAGSLGGFQVEVTIPVKEQA
ncbi:MAG: sensor histidine kinase, partial [Rhodoglobus sp.]|nr:sensor histidine kinase [Rhodoglobus sp.]